MNDDSLTSPSINEVVANVMKALLDLDEQLGAFADSEPQPEELGSVLIDLHALKAGMTDVYGTFTAKAGSIFRNQNIEDLAMGASQIEVRTASDRKKWEHGKLANEVSRRLISSAVDMDTGEVLMSTDEVVTKLLDYIQPSYWRIKELAKLGINADNYCEVGDYKTNIIIRKAK